MTKQSTIKNIIGLSFSLAKAKIKLRHEGSYLGILWYVIEPLVSFGILLMIGGALSQNQVVSFYPVYVFLGLMIFNFFTAATSLSIHSIHSNSGLIKTMKIEKEPFVISVMVQFIFSHVVSYVILIILIIYHQLPITGLFLYPFLFLFLVLFVLGVSFILATVGVYINDLTNIWGIANRLWWLATPIFYSVKHDHALHVINYFNPLYYFIHAARRIVIYNEWPEAKVLMAILIAGPAVCYFGHFVFNQFKDNFAEKI